MTRSPTAAYSIRLRVRLDNRPGSLGRLATAIGDAGGNITALGGFDVRGPHLEEDLVVTDGTAVLGLGDIGPEAAMPVMEGKALLFKHFAGVDGFPICLDARSADDIVDTVCRIAPTFGGINLEDIAAPRCFEVEERLKDRPDIPVFHDDQHGTALRAMAPDPIVFAMANPDPEITPEDADGLAGVIATGRSDYPNQINNVLAFPGIFRGALDVAASAITEGMKLAAAKAIAGCVAEDELKPDHIVPSVFDPRVAPEVATAVAGAAIDEGVVRVHRPPQA
jgi:malic enzyme